MVAPNHFDRVGVSIVTTPGSVGLVLFIPFLGGNNHIEPIPAFGGSMTLRVPSPNDRTCMNPVAGASKIVR
jgi:hypothetical protein